MLLIEAQLKLLSSEAQGPILRFVRCLVFAPARHQTNRCTLKAGAHFELGAAFCSACVCSRYRSKQIPLIEHVLVALMRFLLVLQTCVPAGSLTFHQKLRNCQMLQEGWRGSWSDCSHCLSLLKTFFFSVGVASLTDALLLVGLVR